MTVAEDPGIRQRLRHLVADAEAARANTRREGDQDRPLGPRAERTRSSILTAGIEVFCERGYTASTVTDVHTRAGVSLGTYYQYFRDKTDLITTIVADAVLASAEQMFHTFDPAHGRGGVQEVVERFVGHYATTADFQRVWEEVTLLEPRVAAFRHQLVDLLELSLAGAIVRGQGDGVLDESLEPRTSARALAAMVDRTCFLTFVVEGRRSAVPDVCATLSQLWSNALQIQPTGGPT